MARQDTEKTPSLSEVAAATTPKEKPPRRKWGFEVDPTTTLMWMVLLFSLAFMWAAISQNNPTWIAQLIGGMGIGLVIIIWLIHLRNKYHKEAIGHLWAEFLNDVNHYEHTLLEVIDGFVYLPKGSDPKDPDTKKYAVGQAGLDLWPPGRPRALQSAISKEFFDKRTMEPLSNRRELLIIGPQRFQRFCAGSILTAAACLQQAQNVDEIPGVTSKKRRKTSWVPLIVILIIVLLGVFVFFALKYANNLNKALGIN